MSGEPASHQPALPPVDNQPRMWTASAFLKLTTQVLHEYLSNLPSWHSTYRCHLEHAENQRQKFVVSHPDCAAGDLQLHERTVRMRVRGVGADSLRALMRRPTQE